MRMRVSDGFVSVDDHVQEPPDLWTSRLSRSRFGDRIPHIEISQDSSERWVVDGQTLLRGAVARASGLLADRNQEPVHWAEVPAAACVPSERLKIMDAAGVAYSVLYPIVSGMAGECFARLNDPELELACVRAYNDWLVEEWAAVSDRFVPQCIVPISSTEATVAEIERAVALGHRGVVFPPAPMALRDVPHVGEPDWDPVWAVCEQLDVPLCLHAGGTPPVPYATSSVLVDAIDSVTTPLSNAAIAALFLFSRIALRRPALKIIFAESALGWGAAYLEWADHQFEEDGLAREPYTYAELRHEGYEVRPSELFRRQCYFNGWFEPVAPWTDYLGADRILWSTNLPLGTSTWPKTRETVESCFQGVPDEVRRSVLVENASRLYRL
jgi:predicted TIM-barrel fold metal-dependent hydrolase